MDDLISRQAAIAVADSSDYVGLSVDDVKKVTDEVVKGLKQLPSAQLPENWWKTDHGYMWLCPHCGLPVHSDFEECLRCGIRRPPAQPESINQIRWERDTAIQQLADLGYGLGEKPRTDGDCISRQAAIEAICEHGTELERRNITVLAVTNHKQVVIDLLETLPSVQPTLYGYKIEYLELIGMLLQKANLSPERLTEILLDVDRIVRIICDEYENILRNAMEV